MINTVQLDIYISFKREIAEMAVSAAPFCKV